MLYSSVALYYIWIVFVVVLTVTIDVDVVLQSVNTKAIPIRLERVSKMTVTIVNAERQEFNVQKGHVKLKYQVCGKNKTIIKWRFIFWTE